jgi:hypothetical protein
VRVHEHSLPAGTHATKAFACQPRTACALHRLLISVQANFCVCVSIYFHASWQRVRSQLPIATGDVFAHHHCIGTCAHAGPVPLFHSLPPGQTPTVMLSRSAVRAAAAAARTPVRVVTRGMAKDIRHGREAREPLLRGVNILADSVAVTMGPRVSALLPATDRHLTSPLEHRLTLHCSCMHNGIVGIQLNSCQRVRLCHAGALALVIATTAALFPLPAPCKPSWHAQCSPFWLPCPHLPTTTRHARFLCSSTV